jgi:outer membrane protein OmpA-like peptidoglycan-associated protein
VPTATGINPVSGTTGNTVVISGTNLTGATAVSFGTTSATSFTVNGSGTQLTAVVPARTAGAVNVVVTTPGGSTAAIVFTYVSAPTVTSVSPNTGIDTGGSTVTITGTGFLGTISVAFGGVLATGLSVISNTQISVVTPANTVGPTTVSVTTAGGTGLGPNAFTYLASVRITPATQSGNYSAGTAITPTTAFTATGFTGAVSYSVLPALPAGLVLDASTGIISGTPTGNQAITTYVVTARGATSGIATAQIIISVNARLTPATQTFSYAAGVTIVPTPAFTTAGFTGTVIYQVSPPLPVGLGINTTTGAISGMPTVAQPVITYTITATGTTTGSVAGSGLATALITIGVTAGINPTTRSVNLTQNVAMTPTSSYTLAGFSGDLNYSISPALPSGLTLNKLTGVISGTPTTLLAPTTFTITVTGSISGNGTTTVGLAVFAPLAAPAAVTATAGDKTASLNWSAVTGATSYQVTPTPSGPTCTVTGNQAACINLVNGTRYSFRVAAINAAGPAVASSLSNSVVPTAPFTTKTKRITIYYVANSVTVPTNKLNELRSVANQFKTDNGTAATVTVKGFVAKLGSTPIERNLALTRAKNVAKALRNAGLKAKYTSTADGLANQTGPRSRKVVVNVSYQVAN